MEKKFLWEDIIYNDSYVLVHAEYSTYPCYCDTFYAKEGEDQSKYINWSCCQVMHGYLIDDLDCCTEEENQQSKELILSELNKNFPKWKFNTEMQLLNREKCNYTVYAIDFKAHAWRSDGYEIHLGYVHKSELDNYLNRRETEKLGGE